MVRPISADGFVDQGRGFAQQDGALNFEPAFGDKLLGLFRIGALQPDDYRHLDIAYGLVGVDDALRHPVAADDAAEDIDENGFYLRVLQDDPETRLDRRSIGRSADVQEVGRLAAAQLYHIHGSHGEARAIHHATY